MKKHVKVYLKAHGYTEDDIILCERCGFVAVDIHHIDPRGMGGSKTKDVIENLIALCRSCHEMAEAGIIDKAELKQVVAERTDGQETT